MTGPLAGEQVWNTDQYVLTVVVDISCSFGLCSAIATRVITDHDAFTGVWRSSLVCDEHAELLHQIRMTVAADRRVLAVGLMIEGE